MLKILTAGLRLLSRLTVKRFSPIIVGVTGSAGKTSAKDAIAAVLSATKRVRASKDNFNTELGFPLTILGDFSDEELQVVSRSTAAGERKIAKAFFWLKVLFWGFFGLFKTAEKYPEVLVLEYGADHPGDISRLLKIAKPHIAIITAIGDIPVHVEFYSDIEAVVKEKSKLIKALPADGTAILNIDDARLVKLMDNLKTRVKTFGYNENADLVIGEFETKLERDEQGRVALAGVSFKLFANESFVPVRLHGSVGKAQTYAAAAAAAVGLTFGMNLVLISESLEYFKLPKQRMNFISLENGVLILDDSYNSSPIAARHAIETAAEIEAKRRIAILGDMRELGPYTLTAHQSVGRQAAGVFNKLVLVGESAKIIGEAAKKSRLSAKNIIFCKNAEEAVQAVKPILKKGDLILIKGSLSVGLKDVARQLSLD